MENKEYIGYKVMKTENGKIISGKDSRQKFDLKINKEFEMTGNGLYLGMDKDYVMTYYSGLADEEVLLELKFKKSDIITGSLDDREPEISVRKAIILSYSKIIDGEFVPDKPSTKKKMKPI
jgi:hypothetical protein